MECEHEQGTYSVVRKLVGCGRPIAIKEAKDDLWSFALIEVMLLGFLRHKNIIVVTKVACDGYTLRFEMPFVASTYDVFLRKLRAGGDQTMYTLCTEYMACVCSAVAYCHSAKVIHGDIKPANVLIEGNKAILCDFGLSRACTSGRGLIQSAMYRAPEVTMGYTWKDNVDVWSIGIMWLETAKATAGQHLLVVDDTECPLDVYKAIFGSPFDGRRQHIENIIARQLTPCYFCPKWVHPVITKCLAFDPSERISSLDLYNIVIRHVPGKVKIAQETFHSYLAKKEAAWASRLDVTRQGILDQFIDDNLRDQHGCSPLPVDTLMSVYSSCRMAGLLPV